MNGVYDIHINGQTSTVIKYYTIAGQRVMRDSSGLYYLVKIALFLPGLM